MPTAFQDLRASLLSYKEANAINRKAILDKVVNDISNLPATVKTKLQAINAYRKMAYAATLINYADALFRIEHQDYFDILMDFKIPELFKYPQFKQLNDYFEFHPTAVQMRLKKPIADIPTTIWELFREAQQQQLKEIGTTHKFNLTELSITNPPRDQLYPLPIQMMGRYENESVDRVSANDKGEYRFAERYGYYLLPGGGMLDIDLDCQDAIIRKLIDEHLEEERGNLWLKAANLYNQLEPIAFITTLKECISKYSALESILKNQSIRKHLLATLEQEKANATVMAAIIALVDNITVHTAEQKKLTHELRADIQLAAFRLTPLYSQSIDYIKHHSRIVRIEQFCDTRVCGGKQISNGFLILGEPLEEWFSRHFEGAECQFADDLTGCSTKYLTLLQALTHFKHVKFSHVLIVLSHQLECFDHNTFDFHQIWDHGDYDQAKKSLMKAAKNEYLRAGT